MYQVIINAINTGINYINDLSPFVQGLLGSAAFAIIMWIGRKIFDKAKKGGSEFLEVYFRWDVVKHFLHKEYVNSRNLKEASYGASIALLQTTRWIVISGLTLIFFFGVSSITKGEWIYVLACWIAFNCLYEGHTWIKDSSDPKNISHVSEEKKIEVARNFGFSEHEELES